MIIIKKYKKVDEDENQNPESQSQTDVNQENKDTQSETPDNSDAINVKKEQLASIDNEKNNAVNDYNNVRKTAESNIVQLRSNPSDTSNASIVSEYKKIRDAKSAYNDKMKQIEENRIQIADEIAKLGGDVPENLVESMKFSFSKNLFESVVNNRTADMCNIIVESFDDIPDLSYQPSAIRCKTYARLVIGYINSSNWNDKINHWDDLEIFIRKTLSKSTVSLSKKEFEKFINNFKIKIRNSVMFNWIFGENAPSVDELTNEDVIEPVGDSAANPEYRIDGVDNDDVIELRNIYEDDFDRYITVEEGQFASSLIMYQKDVYDDVMGVLEDLNEMKQI